MSTEWVLRERGGSKYAKISALGIRCVAVLDCSKLSALSGDYVQTARAKLFLVASKMYWSCEAEAMIEGRRLML